MSAAQLWASVQNQVAKLGLISTSEKYAVGMERLQEPGNLHKFKEAVKIEVLLGDVIGLAYQDVDQEDKCLLHNMCNDIQRGGFPHLTGAMEEKLFRTTDISGRLPASLYPIRQLEMVVTRDVTQLAPCSPSTNTRTSVDVISGAALNVSSRSCGKQLAKQDELVMRIKIEILLYLAWMLGYTCLYLSAWGCGGFGCPPEHIAEMFRDALGKDGRWSHAFRRVRFIIHDSDASQPHSNYAVFKRTLQP